MSRADDLDALLDDEALKGGYAQHLADLRAQLHEAHTEIGRLRTLPSTKPQTHLFIGDSHADPDVPNDRYRWLGRMVADLGPDVVIDIGDWTDIPSLSKYDYGKLVYEGRRLRKCIDAGVQAREWFMEALGGYLPRLIHTRGNHEERINKLVDGDPKLAGFVSTDDLKVKELGWEEYPFMVPAVVDGIAYQHCFPSGVNMKPIGGMNVASNMIRLGLMSCGAGHGHTLDYSERTRADGKKVMAFMGGCYFSHFMPWAGAANSMYARGIAVIKDVVDGYGDFEWHSIESIEAEYGD